MLVIGSLNVFAAEKVVSRKPTQQIAGELSADAAKTIGDLLRHAEQAGNKSVKFGGGPQVTTYMVGNLTCYFQNADDSVSCSINQ